MEPDELLTPQQVCLITKISHHTLYTWTSTGKIRRVKAGSLNRYWKSDVLAFLNSRTEAEVRHE
jgi:excisionase family DNA binding protein